MVPIRHEPLMPLGICNLLRIADTLFPSVAQKKGPCWFSSFWSFLLLQRRVSKVIAKILFGTVLPPTSNHFFSRNSEVAKTRETATCNPENLSLSLFKSDVLSWRSSQNSVADKPKTRCGNRKYVAEIFLNTLRVFLKHIASALRTHCR